MKLNTKMKKILYTMTIFLKLKRTSKNTKQFMVILIRELQKLKIRNMLKKSKEEDLKLASLRTSIKSCPWTV